MTDAKGQTVFIVDDDDAVRDSIAELVLSVGLRAECHASARAFLAAYRPERSGCVVLDVRMSDMSGLALQDELNARGAAIPVIVLTGHGDVQMAVQAMKARAVDFLEKPYREQALLDSIHAALSADATARRTNGSAERYRRCLETLTTREREVLDHMLAGRTSKQIARTLAISPRTAEAHRRNLLQKFGAGSARELLSMAPPSAAK